jgi:hypothetical protein
MVMRKQRWSYLGLALASAAALGFLVYSMPGSRQLDDDSDSKEPEARSPLPAAVVERFPFPEDQGGKLLEELLAPAEPVAHPASAPPSEAPHGAQGRRPQTPATPLPPLASELPRFSVAPVYRPARPRLLPEDAPLSRSWFAPVLPEQPRLPASPGVRLPSPKVDEPPPLPILAQPQIDRTSDDPTAAFTTLMALSASMPARLTPVPFVPLVLPDPFVHSREVRTRSQPVEESLPVSTPRLPRK